MQLKIIMVAVLLGFYSYFSKSEFTLPSGYEKCNISDPHFNTCATKSLGKLVSMGVKGIPSLGIKPLDPVFVKYACFLSTGGSPINMKLEVHNLTLYGMSQIKVISTQGTNLKENIIAMKGVIPNATAISSYVMTGSVLSMPLSGFGITEINLYNLTMNYKSLHSPVEKAGKTFLIVKNITVATVVKSGHVTYQSDPKSPKMLGLKDDDVNAILNENFVPMYEEYKKEIDRLFLVAINPKVVKFNNEVPFEDMFIR